MRRSWFLLLAGLAALAAGGCIYVYTSTTEREQYGRALDQLVAEHVAVGETTRAELVAALGPPNAAAETGDGTLLTYDRHTVEESERRVLFLFRTARRVTTVHRHSFLLEDGVVQRWWKEILP